LIHISVEVGHHCLAVYVWSHRITESPAGRCAIRRSRHQSAVRCIATVLSLVPSTNLPTSQHKVKPHF